MKKIRLPLSLILPILITGCLSGTAEYEGISFPQTTTPQVSFQESTIPADCSVFAHLLMNSKRQATGKDIEQAMQREAADRGAHLILVGLSREAMDEELEENLFSYYGPEYAYNFDKTWLGWKFGFDEWNDGDKLVSLGADTWGRSEVIFDSTLIIQAIFLRCGE